jgi:hypothetical protein
MIEFTERLGEPLFSLHVDPSSPLQNPVLLACPVTKRVSSPASRLRK